MALTAAQLLDELMGRDRNLIPGEKSNQVHWSHDDVCRHFLCGFCVNDLFTNTKADYGQCAKIHDEILKQDYESSSRYGKMGYEEDFVRYLHVVQTDVERKIRRGHDRLSMNKAKEAELSANDNESTKILTDRIEKLIQEIEQLGNEGKVEEAHGLSRLLDQLKEERERSKIGTGIAGQEKQMEVCEVCGAFLIVGDVQSRVDDHLQGKQHLAYAKIKSTIEDMKERPWLNKRRDRRDREKEREDGRTDKDKREEEDREKERERNREREKERDREKEKEREKERDREKAREKERERERYREKEREGDREKDRSKDRGREKTRDRERQREKEKERDNSERATEEKEEEKEEEREKVDKKENEREKDKERERERDRGGSRSSRRRSSEERSRDRRRSRSRSRDRHSERDRHRSRDKGRDRRDRDRDRDRNSHRSRRRSKSGSRSHSHSRDRSRRSRSRDRSRKRSHSRDRSKRSRSGDRSRKRSRSRSRTSRSRSRSRSHSRDKKRDKRSSSTDGRETVIMGGSVSTETTIDHTLDGAISQASTEGFEGMDHLGMEGSLADKMLSISNQSTPKYTTEDYPTDSKDFEEADFRDAILEKDRPDYENDDYM